MGFWFVALVAIVAGAFCFDKVESARICQGGIPVQEKPLLRCFF